MHSWVVGRPGPLPANVDVAESLAFVPQMVTTVAAQTPVTGSRRCAYSNMSFAGHRSILPILVWASSVLLACESKTDSESREPASAPVSSNLAAFAGPARVEVTKDGFQPNRVVVGSDRKITFRRTSDATYATAVVFPEVGIEKQSPLNSDVVIELPASAPRELSFQCGMGMYKSKVVID